MMEHIGTMTSPSITIKGAAEKGSFPRVSHPMNAQSEQNQSSDAATSTPESRAVETGFWSARIKTNDRGQR